MGHEPSRPYGLRLIFGCDSPAALVPALGCAYCLRDRTDALATTAAGSSAASANSRLQHNRAWALGQPVWVSALAGHEAYSTKHSFPRYVVRQASSSACAIHP